MEFSDYYEEYDEYEMDEYSSEEPQHQQPHDNSPFGPDVTAKAVYDNCMEPTLYSAYDQVVWLLCCCLVFRICTQLVNIPRLLCHVISILCGVTSLFSLVGPTALYTTILAIATFICLVACGKRSFSGHTYLVVMGTLLTYLVVREYFSILPESWEQVRGVHMIMIMKTLSLCYELWNGSRKEIPPLLEYVGYMFCPGTIIFGPWISFDAYLRVFEHSRWGLGWALKVFATGVVSIVCLGFSSCWIYWMFAGLNVFWIIAVRDAMSVRFSHYFVCFMSEVTTTLCGFYSEEGVSVEVTNPWKIELPRSLVEVVIHWNVSMHKWLRHHVFRPAKEFGPFKSVTLTFLVSSMLHGMNINLTLVLLSLGFYTYVKYTLREKLANIFDACIRSRSCRPTCQHSVKSSDFFVIAVNLAFGFWAYFHLAYLGVMMDRGQMEEGQSHQGVMGFISDGLKRWDELGYASHWATLIVYIGSLVI